MIKMKRINMFLVNEIRKRTEKQQVSYKFNDKKEEKEQVSCEFNEK